MTTAQKANYAERAYRAYLTEAVMQGPSGSDALKGVHIARIRVEQINRRLRAERLRARRA